MRIQASSRSIFKLLYLVTAAIVCSFFLRAYWTQGPTDSSSGLLTHPQHPLSGDLPCRNLPGTENVFVSLKTGSTEVKDKLDVHLKTTLRCYPHHQIYSDYEEDLGGEHILDALQNVDPSIQASHSDFGLWRQLREHGRASLQPEELSGTNSKEINEELRKQNPGWRLDKWKFLPLLNQTLQDHPNFNWYLFVEADTYILWSSLLLYLDTLSHSAAYYIGSEIDNDLISFAHGGSGYALSRPALERVVALFAGAQQEWETLTDGHTAGDVVLAVALDKAGIKLRPSWPSWQGEDVAHIIWNPWYRSPRMWCRPAVSYHHEGPAAIADLWTFEQNWILEKGLQTIRHRDIFEKYIIPRIQQSRSDWDNHSGDDRGTASSLNACKAICEAEPECLQYAFREGHKCATTTEPFLGDATAGVESGWMPERFEQYRLRMSQEPCE